mmetsp:Transcript_88065/g.278511  ORF Transcript_88065/g.278511 Transcript_88065/m.278511 type:complete len:250 (+) Transcript_88065:641-1390(+)
MQSDCVASSRPLSISRTSALACRAPAASSSTRSRRPRWHSRCWKARRSWGPTSPSAAKCCGIAKRNDSAMLPCTAAASAGPMWRTKSTPREKRRPGAEAKCASSTATALLPTPAGPDIMRARLPRLPPLQPSKWRRIPHSVELRPTKSSTLGGSLQASSTDGTMGFSRTREPEGLSGSAPTLEPWEMDLSRRLGTSPAALQSVVICAFRWPKSRKRSAQAGSLGSGSTLNTCRALSQELMTDCWEHRAK